MKQIRAGPAGMLGHPWARAAGKEGLVYRGTASAIRRERDLQGKSTLCPLAGGSGSASMPPIPPPPSLRSGKVTGSSLHKPDEVETKSGPRLCVRDLETERKG